MVSNLQLKQTLMWAHLVPLTILVLWGDSGLGSKLSALGLTVSLSLGYVAIGYGVWTFFKTGNLCMVPATMLPSFVGVYFFNSDALTLVVLAATIAIFTCVLNVHRYLTTTLVTVVSCAVTWCTFLGVVEDANIWGLKTYLTTLLFLPAVRFMPSEWMQPRG